MNYSLSKISFGTSKKNNICEIDIDANISDICYVADDSFVFTSDDTHCLGYIKKGVVEFPWVGRMSEPGDQDGYKNGALFVSPLSLCFNKSQNFCFIVEKGGSGIRKVEISSGYTSSLEGTETKILMDRYFSKVGTDNYKTAFCAIGTTGHLYWVVESLNRCFKYNFSDIENVMGNGCAGYSLSTNLKTTLLNKPSGICFIGESTYISDKGNRCIRIMSEEKNTCHVVAGEVPSKGSRGDKTSKPLLGSPSKIVSCGNMVYFMDNMSAKYLSSSNNGVGIVYESNKLHLIGTNNKKDLLILERG